MNNWEPFFLKLIFGFKFDYIGDFIYVSGVCETVLCNRGNVRELGVQYLR